MYTQIPVARAEQLLQLGERKRWIHGKSADDGESRAFVNQAVKLRCGDFGGQSAGVWL
jgi:hypothetical protein